MLEGAQSAAGGSQEREGSRVRTGYAPAALPAIAPPASQRLASGVPRLEASMHEGAPLELIEEVRAVRLDAAIVSLPAPTAGLRARGRSSGWAGGVRPSLTVLVGAAHRPASG